MNKKYRINELLDKLSVRQNKKALHVLPALLEVSQATFNNYRAIQLDDKQDIPHTAVARLEQFFDLQPGQLQNFKTEITPISQMPDEPGGDIASELSLTK